MMDHFLPSRTSAFGRWPTSPVCKFTPTYLYNADREITGGAPLLALFREGAPLDSRHHLAQVLHRVSRICIVRRSTDSSHPASDHAHRHPTRHARKSLLSG